MKTKKSLLGYMLLITIVLILINILSFRFFARLDFTADKRYTLSKATKDILKNLDNPVTVTAYFSEDLPADISRTKREFKDMLVEYGSISRGKVVYEFIDPLENQELEQKAMQSGVQPVIVNVREKDQVKQQKVYLGAVLQMDESSEVIPFMQPGAAMEYALSSNIKKLSVIDKPSVGLLQGHGEASLASMNEVVTALSVLYNVSEVNIDPTSFNLGDYKTIAIISPSDTFPPYHFSMLDQYLAQGGNLVIAYNKVEGDFNTVQGTSKYTGLEDWLQGKGVTIESNFVVDANCGSIGLTQQQGGFRYTSQINFPYFPIISKFSDHPVTKGLEAVILQFASSIIFTGDTSVTFIPIVQTSDKSGTMPAPLSFNIQGRWTDANFPDKNICVGAAVSGKLSGNTNSRMVVFSDGDFPISGEGQQARQIQPDNVNLIVNSIDWLSDDTGLIDLRTKGVSVRLLDPVEDGRKAFLKYLNFLLPILLIIAYGIFRSQMNRNKRVKRMEEGYV